MSQRGGRSIVDEIEAGRCVACGLLCDAYFCDACCFDSAFVAARSVRDDERVARIRSASRQQSFSDHRAAIVDQIGSMQSSAKDRATAAREFPTCTDRQEIGDACDRVLGPPKFETSYGFEFAAIGLRRAKRDAKFYARFCEGWGRFAWAMLEALTKPECHTVLPESAAC